MPGPDHIPVVDSKSPVRPIPLRFTKLLLMSKMLVPMRAELRLGEVTLFEFVNASETAECR